MKATKQLINYEIMCRHESGRRTTKDFIYKEDIKDDPLWPLKG